MKKGKNKMVCGRRNILNPILFPQNRFLIDGNRRLGNGVATIASPLSKITKPAGEYVLQCPSPRIQ